MLRVARERLGPERRERRRQRHGALTVARSDAEADALVTAPETIAHGADCVQSGADVCRRRSGPSGLRTSLAAEATAALLWPLKPRSRSTTSAINVGAALQKPACGAARRVRHTQLRAHAQRAAHTLAEALLTTVRPDGRTFTILA
jgi:hypothetical protein